jgi:hypothetical protein
VYGRRVTVRGKTTRQGNSEQIIVVPGHHEPYVTPEVWAQIQAQLAHNQLTVRQPAGHGSALCQGLLRCGRCGLMMCVQYYPRQDRMGCSYLCIQGRRYFGRPPCWAVNGRVLDEVVAADLLQSLRPPELEAVIHAAQEVNAAYEAVVRQRQAEVEQAQYEVDLAWRRYQNVDPANRRTARALECDHEQKQAALEALERRHAESRTVPPLAATPEVVAAIHTGARDLPALWAAPSTTHQDRKTLLRLFVREIRLTECTAMTFDIEIRWVGGATTRHTIAHPTAFSRLAERLQAQGCTEEQIVEEARCRALRTGRQGRSYDLNDVRATLRRRARKGQQRTRPPWKTHCESLRPLLSELAGSGLCDRAVAEEFNRRRIDGYFPGKPWDEQKVLVVRRALGIACGRASYTAQHPLRDLLRKLVAKKRSDGEIAAEFNRQGCQGFTISLPWTAGKISDLRHRLGILQRRARRRRRATPAAVHTEAA